MHHLVHILTGRCYRRAYRCADGDLTVQEGDGLSHGCLKFLGETPQIQRASLRADQCKLVTAIAGNNIVWLGVGQELLGGELQDRSPTAWPYSSLISLNPFKSINQALAPTALRSSKDWDNPKRLANWVSGSVVAERFNPSLVLSNW